MNMKVISNNAVDPSERFRHNLVCIFHLEYSLHVFKW